MEKLAIDGGSKVRETPFPKRAPFGQKEALLLEAVRSQNLLGKSGKFAEFYGVRFRWHEWVV